MTPPTYLARLRVEAVEIELAISIGEEIDDLTDPHRLSVVTAAGWLGNLLIREIGKLENPDPRGRAPAVVLPLAEALTQRRVGQVLLIRRDRPVGSAWDRYLLWHASIHANREEL